jgi:hypothetical protein
VSNTACGCGSGERQLTATDGDGGQLAATDGEE